MRFRLSKHLCRFLGCARSNQPHPTAVPSRKSFHSSATIFGMRFGNSDFLTGHRKLSTSMLIKILIEFQPTSPTALTCSPDPLVTPRGQRRSDPNDRAGRKPCAEARHKNSQGLFGLVVRMDQLTQFHVHQICESSRNWQDPFPRNSDDIHCTCGKNESVSDNVAPVESLVNRSCVATTIFSTQ